MCSLRIGLASRIGLKQTTIQPPQAHQNMLCKLTIPKQTAVSPVKIRNQIFFCLEQLSYTQKFLYPKFPFGSQSFWIHPKHLWTINIVCDLCFFWTQQFVWPKIIGFTRKLFSTQKYFGPENFLNQN